MELVIEWVSYLITGAVAGTMAGLFGVGGGLIIVPALIVVFSFQGFSPEVTTHVAVGTSLATIVLTSLSSTLGHYRKQAIFWPAVAMLMPGLVIGAWLGVAMAIQLSSGILQFLIGFGVIIIGLRLLRKKRGAGERPLHLPPPPLMMTTGSLIGLVSTVFGIGGGTMTVPFLTRYGMPLRQAVGTSAASGIAIAVMGAVANGVLGGSLVSKEPALSGWSSGLIYWPAFAGIVLTSVPFARVGAWLTHRLPADMLRIGFACLLFIVGIKFILGD